MKHTISMMVEAPGQTTQSTIGLFQLLHNELN